MIIIIGFDGCGGFPISVTYRVTLNVAVPAQRTVLMRQLPPVTPYIESAFQLARAKYGVEHGAWIDLSFRLAGRVSLTPLSANLQRVGDLDLMLRAMEDEHVANATSAAQGLSHALHYQMMFTETCVVL